jgi:hypothetical protein
LGEKGATAKLFALDASRVLGESGGKSPLEISGYCHKVHRFSIEQGFV